MKKLTNEQLSKFDYFGGFAKFAGLYMNYYMYTKDKLYIDSIEFILSEPVTDVTMNETVLAVVISIMNLEEMGYMDVLIDKQRYVLKLSKNDLDKLLETLLDKDEDPDKMIEIYNGQPYFMTVEDGFAKNMELIDFTKYTEAFALVHEPFMTMAYKTKEEQ